MILASEEPIRSQYPIRSIEGNQIFSEMKFMLSQVVPGGVRENRTLTKSVEAWSRLLTFAKVIAATNNSRRRRSINIEIWLIYHTEENYCMGER